MVWGEFSINETDKEKLKKFEEQHLNCPSGIAADKYSYTFVPTSLGMAITVKCSCGQTLALGDFLDSNDNVYDEEKTRPLSKQDQINEKFEEAALSIIRFKRPRIARVAFGKEQAFEMIYAYSIGVASCADERISKAILYKMGTDKNHVWIQNYKGDDAEKIKLFYESFEKNIREEIKKYDCKNQQLLDELYPEEKEG